MSDRILNREIYYKDHILMRQGEMGKAAYYIERGRVEVYIRDKNGKKIILATLGPGSIIGEMAVISREPRSATVEVIEESVIVQITAHDFTEKLKGTELVFQAILKLLIERLKAANQSIFETGSAIEALEDKADDIVDNIAAKLPEEKQAAFRQDVLPRLQALQAALNKYR